MQTVKRWLRLGLAGFMGASALAFVALSAQQFWEQRPCAAQDAGFDDEAPVAEDALGGLWLRQGDDPKLFRFYYFHGDGKGLYRYGQRELNQTNSFDYRIRNGKLVLSFRKDGQRHETAFEIKGPRNHAQLRLAKDPKEPGASYVRVAGPMRPDVVENKRAAASLGEGAFAEPREIASASLREVAPGSSYNVASALPSQVAPASPRELGSSMWIHTRNFSKGGGEFGMYQFNAPAMDGRGVGWFHRGDFDDWSTESFRYRIDDQRIIMDFELLERREVTAYQLIKGPKKTRFLQLAKDPRNYWLHRQYRFMGPSFGAHPAFAMWTDLHLIEPSN